MTIYGCQLVFIAQAQSAMSYNVKWQVGATNNDLLSYDIKTGSPEALKLYLLPILIFSDISMNNFLKYPTQIVEITSTKHVLGESMRGALNYRSGKLGNNSQYTIY